MWFPQIMDKGYAIRFILIILKIPKSKKLWQYLELILLSAYANLGEGNGNPLQYSCLESPKDKGVWWATVYEISKKQT